MGPARQQLPGHPFPRGPWRDVAMLPGLKQEEVASTLDAGQC